jgi:O-methyltransferase involved in polyketide biosynthesis
VQVELGGVPETLLWTLYHRALEARRDDTVLDDPRAIELVDALDYPFAERFGGHPALAQAQALRVRRFDAEVRRFLAAKADGTVVALGEGLETQFWRVDNGQVDWVTVDVPEAIEVRERLLPPGERQTLIARSAFDQSWMDEVDGAAGVLITAQGLFMYFEYAEVERLVHACRARFPGATIVFDAVPRWLAERSRKPRGDGYQPPPWLWGTDRDKRRRLGAERLRLPRGRGLFFRYVAPLLRLGMVEVLRIRGGD